MSQKQAVLILLRSGPKSTNEIINSPFGLAAEYRRAVSELRKEGFRIDYKHGKGGSGIYTLVEFRKEANWQYRFV